VVDRIDAKDRIERAVFERKRFARVGLEKRRPPLKASLLRATSPLRDRLVGELDADDLAPGQACDAQTWAARAAADVQQVRAGRMSAYTSAANSR
jgi:hypothetical protein